MKNEKTDFQRRRNLALTTSRGEIEKMNERTFTSIFNKQFFYGCDAHF